MTWICSEIIKGHAYAHADDSKMCPACMKEGNSGFLIKAEEGDHIWKEYMSLSNSPAPETTVLHEEQISTEDDFNSPIDEPTNHPAFTPVELPNDAEPEVIQIPKAEEIFEPISLGPETDKPLGLCVILMDASGSMQYPAFNNDPTSKVAMIAKAASNGIFDLKDMISKRNAYIAMYTFDHRIKFLFLKSVNDIIEKYKTSEAFEAYLFQELNALDMQGQSDINQALQKGYDTVDKFLNHKIDAFRALYGDKDYPIDINTVLNTETLQTKNIPNVRVFMYSDGLQYANGVESPLINPFKDGGGLADVDLLLGAFIGADAKNGEAAYKELHDVLGTCHSHGHKQFFLIDSPDKVDMLKSLFTMSSVGSGFCHDCLNAKLSKSVSSVTKVEVKEPEPTHTTGGDRLS